MPHSGNHLYKNFFFFFWKDTLAYAMLQLCSADILKTAATSPEISPAWGYDLWQLRGHPGQAVGKSEHI